MRLNQVTLFVTDIPRSKAFYQQLGLELIVDSPEYARFVCPDSDATFSIYIADRVTTGSATVYFECDDLDTTVADLQAKGLEFSMLPTDQPWLWREAYIHDPDGHKICLYYAGENRLNPPWRVKKEG